MSLSLDLAAALTPLAFVVPGPLDQLTGGYLFDRRLVDALRADGRHVDVIELDGRFPDADARACAAAGINRPLLEHLTRESKQTQAKRGVEFMR